MNRTKDKDSSGQHQGNGKLPVLMLTALGVVYGDIGTSPLYAVRECFLGSHGPPINRENVLSVLSLIVWSLILVICVKYLGIVLRADNKGEGGILAIKSLVTRTMPPESRVRMSVIVLGLFGASLLYGDGMITPAISVLSAVEGLHVATPFFDPFIIPISLAILTGLFFSQHHGTARIGVIFGPIMLVWFLVIGIMGIVQIIREPAVILAINPHYALSFFLHYGWRALAVLGTVFLVVTGGEALYADLGHFGRLPIRMGWYLIVFPSLLLNYFGQGAALIQKPEFVHNLFYRMVPWYGLYPLVILSTVATVIASQAVISGAFSLARQAIQLGYSPRLAIVHTSEDEIGQIYVPAINWGLFLGACGLVIGFRRSGSLAHAYGVAVTTTMLVTTVLLYLVSRRSWRWHWAPAVLLAGCFLVVDIAFCGANIVKIASGGWVPLLVAGVVYTMMMTWRKGRQLLADKLKKHILSIDHFLDDIRKQNPARVPGTAVYLTTHPSGVPATLLHNLKHNKVLHEKLFLLTVQTEQVPHVPIQDQLEIRPLGQGLYRAILKTGFSQDINIPSALLQHKTREVSFDINQTTFFLGKESLLITSGKSRLWRWQRSLFAFMSRNARDAGLFFGIPPNRAVELGIQLKI